jgi:hypothetical protein
MLSEPLSDLVLLLLGHKRQRKPFQHICARVEIARFSRRLCRLLTPPGKMLALDRRCISRVLAAPGGGV